MLASFIVISPLQTSTRYQHHFHGPHQPNMVLWGRGEACKGRRAGGEKRVTTTRASTFPGELFCFLTTTAWVPSTLTPEIFFLVAETSRYMMIWQAKVIQAHFLHFNLTLRYKLYFHFLKYKVLYVKETNPSSWEGLSKFLENLRGDKNQRWPINSGIRIEGGLRVCME